MKATRAAPVALAGAMILLPWRLDGAEPRFEQFTVADARGPACEAQPKESAPWGPARDGDVFRAGARGRTGARSSFVASFDEKNRFRLLPGTEVTIRTTTRDPKFAKVVALEMDRGGVEVDLKSFPKGYQLKVQTPTAVCGAVGTEFSVRSDRRESNRIECREGKVFARSAEDGSFRAPSISAGQALEAELAPGKENSWSRVRTEGGDMPLALWSERATLEVRGGSVLQVAQQHSDSASQVALRVERGRVGEAGSGRYVVDNGAVKNVSGDERVSRLVDEYVDLARSEGGVRSDLEAARARGAPADERAKIQARLDAAAAAATAKRNELFAREEIRRAVRDGMDIDRVRPTAIPR